MSSLCVITPLWVEKWLLMRKVYNGQRRGGQLVEGIVTHVTLLGRHDWKN